MRSEARSRLVALPVHALAHQLAMPTNRLGPLAGAALRRLLVVAAHFHFSEDALALHLLLQRAQGLIDIVVANEHLQSRSLSSIENKRVPGPDEPRGWARYHIAGPLGRGPQRF